MASTRVNFLAIVMPFKLDPKTLSRCCHLVLFLFAYADILQSDEKGAVVIFSSAWYEDRKRRETQTEGYVVYSPLILTYSYVRSQPQTVALASPIPRETRIATSELCK